MAGNSELLGNYQQLQEQLAEARSAKSPRSSARTVEPTKKMATYRLWPRLESLQQPKQVLAAEPSRRYNFYVAVSRVSSGT